MSDSFSPTVHRSLAQRLRSWFLTGLVVFGPVAVTAYIAWWAIDTVDNWVRPWLPQSLSPDAYLPFHVPGFGVVIALVGLTLLGFLTANIIGRSLVRFSEAMLDRTPLVRGVYKGLKQVFETVFSQSGTQFRKVGLVEFPVKGSWSIVFVSSAPGEVLVPRPAGGKADDFRVHALHAQSRRQVFSSTSRPTRSSNCRSRPTTPPSSSCRRAHPAGGPGGARRDGGGGEAREAAHGNPGIRF